MLKGAVLLFTYILSILKGQKIKEKQHFSMVLILIALGMISYSNIGSTDRYESNPKLGNGLIILGQFLFSLMFLSEEYLISKYNVQLSNAILWEGIWGSIATGLVLLFFSYYSTPVLPCDIQ